MKKKNKAILPKHIRAHGQGFRAVLTSNGKRIRSRTFPTVEAVQQWLDLVLPDRDRIAETHTGWTLRQCMDTLLLELVDTGAKAGTHSFYETHANTLFAGLGGEGQRIDMLTPRQVQDYVNRRRQKGVSGATIVRKELLILRRWLKIASEAGVLLPVDCLKGIRTPKAQTKRFGYFTAEQIRDITGKMRQDQRGQGAFWADIVELLYTTGLRRAELVRLRVHDIDRQRGTISVQGKTGHRDQPFSSEALGTVLARLVASAQPDGRIVKKEDAVIWAFTTWRRKLGLEAFSAHMLRVSYATATAPRVDPWKLMVLMGHTSLSMTARYYRGRGDDVTAALDALGHDLRDPPSPPSEPPPPAE